MDDGAMRPGQLQHPSTVLRFVLLAAAVEVGAGRLVDGAAPVADKLHDPSNGHRATVVTAVTVTAGGPSASAAGRT